MNQFTAAPISRPAALITGASRGIGRATAERFAAAGYHLILTCISSIKTLREYAARLEQAYGIRCAAVQADMGNYEEVRKVFGQITELDVVVNNAGVSYVGLLSEMETADWQRLMRTNLDSCFYTCKLAVPLLLRKHCGKIINISSVWGSVGASMEVAYSASKGAVNAFTKALAKELAPSNIQVNALAFGMIDTRMNESFTPEELAAITAGIPADRPGSAEEAAQLILLTAQAPPYLTGQVITMDGGWT
ncbi:MAG: SDR family NAD(P)-dependent oxidoreductase [Clostridium sp.]|jgi:3-oxoacyl-[acyl-carrier protein] reductase|nr:SDR family NAD(P)-dependent oxidoreductase [Clostridium sp.]